MPVEMGLWRVDDKPVRLVPAGTPTEARLEELIEAEPTILGEPLLIIGRQVVTSFGKIIDLLAVDADGILHVLELKKDKTPREVVAQVFDYGSWVRSLTHSDVLKLFADYGKGGVFEAAFQQRFDTPPPEELNTGHRLTIIASAVDVATERIIEYLAEAYAVPVNVVFFRYFEDEGHRYLARTWLIEQDRAPEPTGGTSKSKEPWSGRDWYVSFGEIFQRALAGTGIRGHDGQPLIFTPHDFRRIFVTDAVMNGLPPHIAQVICGHRDISTTMGYKAIYPTEAIEAHRAFIARRRQARPSEEYRTPTDEEWDQFLAHFEKRKLSIGICARVFGAPCIHEHACLTEMILVTYPDRCGCGESRCSPTATGKNLGLPRLSACRWGRKASCQFWAVR